MKLIKVKTARFSQIVRECGQPRVYTLWQKPAADRYVHGQTKKNRVVTILKTETGMDFGIVGLKEGKGARYLMFQKSVKQFEGKRIIGVNWALVRD